MPGWLWTVLIAALGGVANALLVAWALRLIRSREAKRRRAAEASGGRAEIPARLRGITLAYPGFWRPGQLNLSIGWWRPDSRWSGMPVSLAGAHVQTVIPAGEVDHLPPIAQPGTVVVCWDLHGQVFQLAVFDDEDADLAGRAVTSTPGAYQSETGVGARMRWLRQRVPAPLFMLTCALAGLAWAGYFLVPLIGARQVTATVRINPGGGRICEVVWTDGQPGGGGHDGVDCGDLRPGEQLRVFAMGWPRTGTANDLDDVLIWTFFGAAVGLGVPGYGVGFGASQRRQLAAGASNRWSQQP